MLNMLEVLLNTKFNHMVLAGVHLVRVRLRCGLQGMKMLFYLFSIELISTPFCGGTGSLLQLSMKS